MCFTQEEQVPEALPLSQYTQPSLESELICVLSRDVEDLYLEWAAPEEPAHGLLDEWFLKVHRQPSSRQQPARFLPTVHDKLTKTWQAPYSALVKPFTSAALTTVVGTEETVQQASPSRRGNCSSSLPTFDPWIQDCCASFQALQDDVRPSEQVLCSG